MWLDHADYRGGGGEAGGREREVFAFKDQLSLVETLCVMMRF